MRRFLALIFLMAAIPPLAAASQIDEALREARHRILYESSDWKQRPAEELALQFLSCKPFSIEVDGTAMVADGRTVQLRERYAEFLKTEVRSIIEEKVRAAIESGNLFYPEMPADGSKLSANFLFSGETYSLRLAYSKRFYDPISKGWMFRPTWEIPWDDGIGGEEDFFEDVSKFLDWFLLRYGTVNTAEECARRLSVEGQ